MKIVLQFVPGGFGIAVRHCASGFQQYYRKEASRLERGARLQSRETPDAPATALR